MYIRTAPNAANTWRHIMLYYIIYGGTHGRARLTSLHMVSIWSAHGQHTEGLDSPACTAQAEVNLDAFLL